MIDSPGHPCHGHSVLDSLAASLSVFSKNMGPVSKQVTSQVSAMSESVSGSVNDVVSTLSDPAQQEQIANSASQIFQNMSNWYNMKKTQWTGGETPRTSANPSPEPPQVQITPNYQSEVEEELKRIQRLVQESKIPPSTTEATETNTKEEFEHINL